MAVHSDEELDPEVSELLPAEDDDDTPEFEDLFHEEPAQSRGDSPQRESVFDNEGFSMPERIESEPHRHFSDRNYYKAVLTSEGEISKRLHELLRNFLKATDPQDRSLHRGKIAPAVWELCTSIAARTGGELSVQKRLFQRYRLLLPTMLSAAQRDTLARVIIDREIDEPVHYVDEWLEHVASGNVNQSATDETKGTKRNPARKLNAQLDKTQGRFDAQLQLLRTKIGEITSHEARLQEYVDKLASHDSRQDIDDLILPYSDEQRAVFTEISQSLRKLSNLNKELARGYSEFDGLSEDLERLRSQEQELDDEDEGGGSMDRQAATAEIGTIRQMAKLCVGRQGNHFPLLLKQYFRASIRDIGSRENVIAVLSEVEKLDPEIFKRTFKQQTNRIVPNIILIPCYGDTGVCWEPFERFNKATSRGRMAVPMYPKDLQVAVIAACGDLRWQIAKEKAAHYWMEEGLTGWYYQWFSENKLKGDVKDRFIEDYILWITKESEGTQKLERDVRGIFWRYIPFPREVKEQLKNRGFVYNELYKKDQNRSLSDGY